MNEELVQRVTFKDVFDTYGTFTTEWTDSGFPNTVLTSDNRALVYNLLYAKYANSTIASIDIDRFKKQVFSIIWQYGPAWQKKLAIQAAINTMNEADVSIRDTTVFNTAANPSTTPATNAFTALTKIDAQNAQQTKRNPLTGWAQLRELIEADFTGQFLDKFKKLFIIIVEGSEGLPPVLTIRGNHIYSEDVPADVVKQGDLFVSETKIKQWDDGAWVTIVDFSEIVSETDWGDIGGDIADQTDLSTALAGKLDKDTSTTAYLQVYMKNANGTQRMWNATDIVSSNTIPIRISGGRLRTGTPENDNEAATKKYVDDLVATKSAVSGTNDGTNWQTITIDGTTKNIPSGGGGGSTAWGDITGTLSNQTDLQSALNGKLDKVSAPTDSAKVYGIYSDGNQNMFPILASATASAIMRRDGNGRCKVSSPSANEDCANKKYVDDAISGAVSTTYYRHNILISTTANRVSFQIISTSSTAYTKSTLVNYFGTNANAKISASGANYSNSRVKTAYQVSGDSATQMTIYVIFDSDGSVDTAEIDVLYTNLTVTDTVETIS